MKNQLSRWLAAAVASVPLLSAAQTPPQLSYRSAFADFKPYHDVPLADWRAVNEAVAPAPQSAKATAPSPASASAPAAAPEQRTAPMTPMPAQQHRHMHGGKP